MIVLGVEKFEFFIVTTEHKEYRRLSSDNWEESIGVSWEPLYLVEKLLVLEKAFVEYQAHCTKQERK